MPEKTLQEALADAMRRLETLPKPKRYVLYACSWSTYLKARPLLKEMGLLAIHRHPISGKRLRFIGGIQLALHEIIPDGQFLAVEEPPPPRFEIRIDPTPPPLPLIDTMWWRFTR